MFLHLIIESSQEHNMADHFVFHTQKTIKLEYKTTRVKTGLCNWCYTQCCVLQSTGDIVFFGKENEDDTAALHIYSFKNGWNNVAKCQHHVAVKYCTFYPS